MFEKEKAWRLKHSCEFDDALPPLIHALTGKEVRLGLASDSKKDDSDSSSKAAASKKPVDDDGDVDMSAGDGQEAASGSGSGSGYNAAAATNGDSADAAKSDDVEAQVAALQAECAAHKAKVAELWMTYARASVRPFCVGSDRFARRYLVVGAHTDGVSSSGGRLFVEDPRVPGSLSCLVGAAAFRALQDALVQYGRVEKSLGQRVAEVADMLDTQYQARVSECLTWQSRKTTYVCVWLWLWLWLCVCRHGISLSLCVDAYTRWLFWFSPTASSTSCVPCLISSCITPCLALRRLSCSTPTPTTPGLSAPASSPPTLAAPLGTRCSTRRWPRCKRCCWRWTASWTTHRR